MHRVGSFGKPIYAQSPTGKSRRVIGHTPCLRCCLDEQEMFARGMVKDENGWWMTRPSLIHWAEDQTSFSEEREAISPFSQRKDELT